MDCETKRMKLAYWSRIIKEAASSGMKISEWCDMNHISRRKYYYWHKKVMLGTYALAVKNGIMQDNKNDATNQDLPAIPEFAELTIPNEDTVTNHCKDPGVKIKRGGFTISVEQGFSEDVLLKVLGVMHHVQ